MYKKNNLVSSNLILILLFLAFLLVRLLNLQADFPKSLNFYPDELTDEGYKTYSARNMALFKSSALEGDQYIGWIRNSPVSQYIFLLFFNIFGIGYAQARLAGIVFSFLGLIFYYLLIKNAFGKKTALLSAFFLGFSYVYIMYNRLALLESIMIFFLMLSLYFWQKSFKNRFYFSLSMLSFVLAYYTKALALFFIPVFLIMAYMSFKEIELKLTSLKIILIGLASLAVIVFVVPKIVSTALSLIDFRGTLSFPQMLVNLRRLLHNSFFKQTLVISLLSLVYPLVLFYNIFEIRKKVNNLEVLFLAWLVSLIAAFGISWYDPHRYLILFIPCMSFLGAIVLANLHDYPIRKKIMAKSLFMKISVFLWLNSVFIIFLVNVYVVLRDYIHLTKSYYMVVSILASLLLSYLIIILARGRKFNTKYLRRSVVLISLLFIVTNLYPYMSWILSPQYTLIDASRELSLLPKDSVVFGGWAPALCLETELKCFNSGGTKNVDEDAFRRLDVSHLLIGPYDFDEHGAEFMNNPNYNRSISLVKTFNVSDNNIDLYRVNRAVYHGLENG
ncbi:glycosyltransferase family 39 protein [Candidatus Woesearchaeota archaeon]|nr:glycosyltransferase family 39 protein [Candidatus Woesearchaeota archaeon]